MKKYICLLCLCFSLLLWGCGRDAAPADTQGPALTFGEDRLSFGTQPPATESQPASTAAQPPVTQVSGASCKTCGRSTPPDARGNCPACYWEKFFGQYCIHCGLSAAQRPVTIFGYCDPCSELYHRGEHGYCQRCKTALSAMESESFGGKRCYNCLACEDCGSKNVAPRYYEQGRRILCEACGQTHICGVCGALDDLVEGTAMCPDCKASNDEDAGRCVHCGGKIPEGRENFCSDECYRKHFSCTECGAPITPDQPSGLCRECEQIIPG